MTGNAEETRHRLIEAATRGFAEQGVHTASLLEITRQAGQRNRGAVHYHFGSREGMLVAVLEQHVDLLAARERELLAVARKLPDDDLASVVAAFARPAVELGDLGWEGRSYLVILSELVEDDPDSLHPDVVAALTRAGGYDAYGLLEERMPPMSDELRLERMSLVTTFILRAAADRARAGDRPAPSRHQLDTEAFIRNLISMSVGMLDRPYRHVTGMRVLVTGAAGSIGRVLLVGLADRGHEVVGLDLVPPPEGDDRPWYVVDCTDPDAVRAVLAEERLDAIVHLAGNPGEGSLPDSLTSHVVTTAALLDAAVAHDVRRFVYASSNHAVGRTPRSDLLTTETRPRPDTFYGVAKVAAEGLLSLYNDRYGMDTLACRIGSFRHEPASVRQLSTWLSPDDCVRMIDACLTTPAPGFAVLYGISDNTRAWWDLEPGRALGYRPEDDAEEFADRIAAAADDASDGAHVGGPFTAESYYRPALEPRGGP